MILVADTDFVVVKSRVLAGYLAQSEEESEAVVEESEDEPSPPVKRHKVVRKMSAAKSASTPEKSRGTKVCSQ